MPLEPLNASRQPERTASTVVTPNTLTSAVPEVNKAASELPQEEKDLEHLTPGTSDTWYEKYGWRGFLDWKTLRVDVPEDRWILGSAWPGLPQLSPRSEARSIAQVGKESII